MLEHVADNRGSPLTDRSLLFDTTNHDDILASVDRVKGKSILPDEEVLPFCVGLKLFGEVVMKHRSESMFTKFFPHFRSFMETLKKSG